VVDWYGDNRLSGGRGKLSHQEASFGGTESRLPEMILWLGGFFLAGSVIYFLEKTTDTVERFAEHFCRL
jgi:hypothetical protein